MAPVGLKRYNAKHGIRTSEQSRSYPQYATKQTFRNMRKGILGFFFFCLISMGKAQGNLQFNQVLLVDSALQTVPATKVWKINSISGNERRTNECVDISANSNHELRSAQCWSVQQTASFYANYFISIFWVNGKRIVNTIENLPNSNLTVYLSTNCTNSWTSGNFTCANRTAIPNILPMWLPAGTTVRTGGPNTLLSVLEFNILP